MVPSVPVHVPAVLSVPVPIVRPLRLLRLVQLRILAHVQVALVWVARVQVDLVPVVLALAAEDIASFPVKGVDAKVA